MKRKKESRQPNFVVSFLAPYAIGKTTLSGVKLCFEGEMNTNATGRIFVSILFLVFLD